MSGTEQAAIAARQAGLLDAYTEGSTAHLSESDKFKEGYKKKGKKNEKPRKSESEDVPPPKEDPPAQQEVESWEDEQADPVDSWEDIEAVDMPVPTKVKQEMRKQEKLRKKAEERKGRDEKTGSNTSPADGVERVSDKLAAASLDDHNAKSNAEQTKPSRSPVEKTTRSPGAARTDSPQTTTTNNTHTKPEKSEKADPEAVKAEREAKKAAKAAAKAAAKQKQAKGAKEEPTTTTLQPKQQTSDKSTDKQQQKIAPNTKSTEMRESVKSDSTLTTSSGEKPADGATEKSKAQLKAERRAKQEAQRAAKVQSQEQKKQTTQKVRVPDEIQADQAKAEKKLAKVLANQNVPPRAKAEKLVPLFSHLHQYEKDSSVTSSLPIVGGSIHASFITLGLQTGVSGYSDVKMPCCETRCESLISALKDVVSDCLTTMQDHSNCDLFKEIDTALKPNLTFLKQCRPLSISMGNAIRMIKAKLRTIDRSLPLETLMQQVDSIFHDFTAEHLDLAPKQISITASSKIKNGDVILTYSESLVVERILLEASKDKKFQVVVADSRLYSKGKGMTKRLVQAGIDCTYISITALPQVLSSITKVMLGCEGVMANGGVLAEVGTSQVALLAASVAVPVLVCCQTFKFTERVQTDSFVNNELLDPQDVANAGTKLKYLDNWRDLSSLHLLNLVYDVTPASLVTAVITELSVIPTTSVPVILRLNNCDGHLA